MVAEASNAESARSGSHWMDESRPVDPGLQPQRLTSLRTPLWRPPTDFYETEEAFIVRVEVAGMHQEDFQVELDGKVLSIRGTRPDVSERRAFHQMEIRFGEFSTEIDLPAPVVAEEVKASYQNGFLRILLPKARSRQIPIRD